MGGGEHASSGLNREQEVDGGEAGQQWAPPVSLLSLASGREPPGSGHMPRRHPANKGNRVWNLVGPLWTVVVFEPDLEKLRSLGGVGSPSGSRRGGQGGGSFLEQQGE